MKYALMILLVIAAVIAAGCSESSSQGAARAGKMNTYVNGRPAKGNPAIMQYAGSRKRGPQ